MMPPLILTLKLDVDSQQFFNNLRQTYFPSERNFLEAHLSLFHQLPQGEEQITILIQTICANQKLIELHVTEIRNIGSGVAYKIESPGLMTLHKYLQQQWSAWLIPQDQHKIWPHITIQNKVEPEVAAALRNKLAENFVPFAASGTGLQLWEYLGGPWKLFEQYDFTG